MCIYCIVNGEINTMKRWEVRHRGRLVFSELRVSSVNLYVRHVWAIDWFMFLLESICIALLHRFKTYMWYLSMFLASRGHLCCWGFGSILIDQVYLGSMINLGLVGALQWWFMCWNIMENNSRIDIEKFNRKNFELWKLNMEDLLVYK